MKLATCFALILLPVSAFGACPMHPDAPPELSANHDCCRIAQEDWEATVQAMKPSDTSLYQLESKWTTQGNEAVSLSRLTGRPQLVALAYTSCQYACPRLLADLKKIEAKIPDGEDIGFTIVSIDPDRDTPERLLEYATEHELDLHHWTLLHGAKEDVLELANLLGVRYVKTAAGDYSHSNIITLLNAKGEIVYQQNGLGADNSRTLSEIAKL